MPCERSKFEANLEVISLPFGGPWGTVYELLFEKKALIPALQQLLITYASSEG
jgi:hypothetical protein